MKHGPRGGTARVGAASTRKPGRTWRIAGGVLAVACTVAAAFIVTLAIPLETWRTGELAHDPLPAIPPDALPAPARRIWIDADPACGAGPRVDPDDCLAITYLALRDDIEIAGLSTVFGNASLDVTHATARELTDRLRVQGDVDLAVHRGAGAPGEQDAAARTDAGRALAAALQRGPLSILALGPLTNVAAVLDARPDLHRNVERIIAVIGRRPGHIFHPSEGGGEGGLLGHGPVFRDFNVVKDPNAAYRVVASGRPLVMVPYEAARELRVDDTYLERMAATGPAGRWVAERARSWLEYWTREIGRGGFYPFDLVAAVFAVKPARFSCAGVVVETGGDEALYFPFSRMPSVLVSPRITSANPRKPPVHLYCHDVSGELPLLASPPRSSGPSSGG